MTALTTRLWVRQWHGRREEAVGRREEAVGRRTFVRHSGLNTKMQTSIKSLPEGN